VYAETVVEEYLNPKVDVALPPALFDPASWSTAPHWAKSSRTKR